MYAIVEISGHQYKVEQNNEIFVFKLQGNAGDKVSFDTVKLIADNGNVQIGTPNLSGVAVNATIVSQLKDDKIIVFKKKRRKGYKVKNGFRQSLTRVKIDSIA